MANRSLLVPFLLVLALSACSLPPASEMDGALDDTDLGPADGSGGSVTRPLGGYRPVTEGSLDLRLLVVRDDRTYYMETTAGESSRGRVRYASSGSYRYIKLYGADDELAARYSYRFVSGQLELRAIDTTTWYPFFIDPNGICTQVDDCSHQGLSGATWCAEWHWTCDTGAEMCSYECTNSSCAFGLYFDELAKGAPTRLTAADIPSLTALEGEQIVAALHASTHTDVTAVEEAFVAADAGEIMRYPIEVSGDRHFVAFQYWAGDNPYGAIFSLDSADPAALVHDGEIDDCTVAP